MNKVAKVSAVFFLLVLSCRPAAAADPKADAAESQGEEFVAHKVENKAEKQAEPQPADDKEPNFITVGGKVVKNPKKIPQESQPPATEEPNFIVEGGKVIPNPRKNTVNPAAVAPSSTSPGPGDSEPNFISVNGQVVPNPNKKKTA